MFYNSILVLLAAVGLCMIYRALDVLPLEYYAQLLKRLMYYNYISLQFSIAQ